MDHLRLATTDDGVAVVTLVDAKRRNAMTLPMVTEIVKTFDALEADPSIGAVVVTGEPPAFCSGADVSSLGAMSRPDADAQERGQVASIYEGFLRVLRSPLPTIAAVNGPAVGAGMNLALACDVRVVGPSGRFDARFLQIGLHPGGGHTWMLDRLVGPQAAAAIVVFGERPEGPRAVEVGLAWSCHADDELLAAACTLAARAAEVPRELSARAKATLRSVPSESFDAALAREIEQQTWSFARGWFHRPR
jgi:enoyl-CoA hydratase